MLFVYISKFLDGKKQIIMKEKSQTDKQKDRQTNLQTERQTDRECKDIKKYKEQT